MKRAVNRAPVRVVRDTDLGCVYGGMTSDMFPSSDNVRRGERFRWTPNDTLEAAGFGPPPETPLERQEAPFELGQNSRDAGVADILSVVRLPR